MLKTMKNLSNNTSHEKSIQKLTRSTNQPLYAVPSSD